MKGMAGLVHSMAVDAHLPLVLGVAGISWRRDVCESGVPVIRKRDA